MAKIRGNGGLVKIAAVTVASVTSFTIDYTMEPIEDTDLASSEKSFQAGEVSWSGTVECIWNQSDPGQGDMIIPPTSDDPITLHLVRDGGEDTPTDDITGDVFITGISSSSQRGSMVAVTYTFQGTGALSGL